MDGLRRGAHPKGGSHPLLAPNGRALHQSLVAMSLLLQLGAATALASTDPPAGFRLFAPNGPWNLRADEAPLQRAGDYEGTPTHDSAAYIDFLDEVVQETVIATSRWSLPLHFVDSRVTPGMTVGFTGEEGYDSGFLIRLNPVPIPAEAVSDPGETNHYPPSLSDIVPDRDLTDAHLCIIDVNRQVEYDFWHLVKDASGQWVASAGTSISTTGSGVIADVPPDEFLDYARGTAVPLAAGVILRQELAAGDIAHALLVTIPSSRNREGFYVWPGLRTDGYASDSRALPEGARLRLRWTEAEIEVRFQAGEISAAGRTIALALRRFGAYVVDNGGETHFGLQAQNISDVSGDHNHDAGSYGELLDLDEDGYASDLWMMRARDFEVVAFGYGRELAAVPAAGPRAAALLLIGLVLLVRGAGLATATPEGGRSPSRSVRT
ncbi:MAG: hypothetical protein HYV63_01055 [Candidatus Schekmanbacteria bacterium]|nr:hypothetical protein [Candidatus Schekmanbacteria bacterium]